MTSAGEGLESVNRGICTFKTINQKSWAVKNVNSNSRRKRVLHSSPVSSLKYSGHRREIYSWKPWPPVMLSREPSSYGRASPGTGSQKAPARRGPGRRRAAMARAPRSVGFLTPQAWWPRLPSGPPSARWGTACCSAPFTGELRSPVGRKRYDQEPSRCRAHTYLKAELPGRAFAPPEGIDANPATERSASSLRPHPTWALGEATLASVWGPGCRSGQGLLSKGCIGSRHSLRKRRGYFLEVGCLTCPTESEGDDSWILVCDE